MKVDETSPPKMEKSMAWSIKARRTQDPSTPMLREMKGGEMEEIGVI